MLMLDKVLTGFSVIGVVFIMFVVANQESRKEKRWQQFKVDHKCKIIGQRDGHTSYGVGTGVSGNGSVAVVMVPNSTPDQVEWKCDNGMTYWKNK